MPNILKIASALDLTGTGPAGPVRLGKTPLLGGHGREGILILESAIGGSGVVKIQGHPSRSHTAPADDDAGWVDVLSLNSASSRVQEIADLPAWVRANVTTAGTGTATINLEGVQ